MALTNRAPSLTRLLLLLIGGTLFGLLAILQLTGWGYMWGFTYPGCRSASGIPGQEQQQITLDTPDGLALPAWYYPGSNGAAIIALGGNTGALGQALPRVDFLLEAGYGVLQVGSRACAHPPAAVTLGAKEALDAQAALVFLQAQPEVRAVGAYGFSMGGAAAIQAAAKAPGIRAVVNDGGYANLGQDILEPDSDHPLLERLVLPMVALAYRIQTGLSPWDASPIEALPALAPRPVLLIFGDAEITSGRGEAQLAAAGPAGELWLVPGGWHGGNQQVAGPEYMARVLAFYNRYLLESP